MAPVSLSPSLDDEIASLLSFRGDPFPVSTLYLTLGRSRDPRRGYVAALKNLIREAERQALEDGLGREQRRSLEDDWAAMLDAVQATRGFDAPAVAVYACSGLGFWSSLNLPEPVENRLRFGSRPYVGPLVRLRSARGAGLVLVVGRNRGRLLRLREGRVIAEERWESDVPQRVKEAGWLSWNEKRIDHHVLDHLHRHLKESVARLALRFRQGGGDWVVVGGSDEPRALLDRHLPPDVSAALIGRVDVPVETPRHELLARVAGEERKRREARRRDLFARLEEAAASGWGSLGFTDTAAAAGRGALDALLLSPDLHAPGRRCRTCGTLVAGDGRDAAARCPACAGEEAMRVNDVYEELICDALYGRAEVVFATEGPEAWLAAGKVGGLLRD